MTAKSGAKINFVQVSFIHCFVPFVWMKILQVLTFEFGFLQDMPNIHPKLCRKGLPIGNPWSPIHLISLQHLYSEDPSGRWLAPLEIYNGSLHDLPILSTRQSHILVPSLFSSDCCLFCPDYLALSSLSFGLNFIPAPPTPDGEINGSYLRGWHSLIFSSISKALPDTWINRTKTEHMFANPIRLPTTLAILAMNCSKTQYILYQRRARHSRVLVIWRKICQATTIVFHLLLLLRFLTWWHKWQALIGGRDHVNCFWNWSDNEESQFFHEIYRYWLCRQIVIFWMLRHSGSQAKPLDLLLWNLKEATAHLNTRTSCINLQGAWEIWSEMAKLKSQNGSSLWQSIKI